jgi:hypothetical protein
MTGALLTAVALIGFVLAAWRSVYYMAENPPRYIGDDDYNTTEKGN